jgi:hypothetical protein
MFITITTITDHEIIYTSSCGKSISNLTKVFLIAESPNGH